MKNIILFQPEFGDFDSMRTKPALPLGLLHCASIVSKDYEIKIIDERIQNDWERVLKDYINEDTICVGVSALTGYTIKGGLNFSKFIKDNYGIPVVWGGIHPTILPEQTLANKYVDIVVEGEGEVTFNELVKALDKGMSLSRVSGIWYKKNGETIKTAKREFINMDEMPGLPYHLINLDDYLAEYMDVKSINFQSSRGCPLRCGYCYNNVVSCGVWRSLSAERTLEEIRKLIEINSNIKSIYFIDDNFFIDKKRAQKIMEGLKELEIKWFSQGVDILTLKKLDDSYYKLIEESNCIKLTVGVESGSERIRDLINKEGTPEDIIEVAHRLKKHKIIFYCDFMVGFPTETNEDIKNTVNLLFKIQKINKHFRNSSFYVYVPYPGTPLYKLIADKVCETPKTLEEWAEYEWDGFNGNNKMFEHMHFASLFIDNKARDYNIPYILRFLVAVYRPVARFRVRNLYFKCMIEIWVYKTLKKIWHVIRMLNQNRVEVSCASACD